MQNGKTKMYTREKFSIIPLDIYMTGKNVPLLVAHFLRQLGRHIAHKQHIYTLMSHGSCLCVLELLEVVERRPSILCSLYTYLFLKLIFCVY